MARVWIESVGCKVSRADVEATLERLIDDGHRPAASVAEADVAVITTCCVTGEAERSSRQRVRRLRARGLPVVVTGCAVVYHPEQFEGPGTAVVQRPVVGAAVDGLMRAAQDAEGEEVSIERDEAVTDGPDAAPGGRDGGGHGEETDGRGAGARTRAVLKVQDGCTSACSYCAVRLVRGAPWSLPPDAAGRAAAQALQSGCGEVVVSGVNLGLYAGESGSGGAAPRPGTAASGREAPTAGMAPVDLAGLVERLLELPGLGRLRLSSLEPQHVGDRLLTALANPLVARHLHLPLQSADDGVLADMARPYTFAGYLDKLAMVRAALPGVMVSTDVIVGFPSESRQAFERTLAAIGETAGLFGRVHVFTFSPRPGTPAAALTPLPAAELRRRRAAALTAARGAQAAAARRLVGRRLDVLVEDRREALWRGYSSEYVRCRVQGAARRGTIVGVRARQAVDGELICEVATTPSGGPS
jgi:threonylcarbamoyladenosine tRNA methylthiotransferase MtaB